MPRKGAHSLENLEQLKEELGREKVAYVCNEPMSLHTTFKVGGKVTLMIRPDSEYGLAAALAACRQTATPYFILGRGSNLLVSDEGADLAIVHLGDTYSTMRMADAVTIDAQSGVSLNKLCRYALDHSLTGLEFAFGIPGSLGGAVYMNAGAYGGEMKNVVKSVRYIDEKGELRTALQDELDFRYRHSMFSGRSCCIVAVQLELAKGDPTAIRSRMDELMEARIEKQPLEFGSAGSTFKRPEGAYAAQLIDCCGLKGFSIGDAQVSEKHAGFIINRGHATCAEIKELIDRVREVVLQKTGYKLECEVLQLG